MLIYAVLLNIIGWAGTLAMVGPCFDTSQLNKGKMGPSGKPNWQSVLREAAYESLSKYTGFTESLDDKLERDTILWDKLHSARFLRKNKYFNSDEVKTGVLVDMTAESGEFEFRQSDKSVYNCPGPLCRPIDSSLLAVWQIHSYGPNNIWIRVKVPLDPPVEDIYEFTSRYGLKQINHRENIDDFKGTVQKEETYDPSSKHVSSEEYEEKPPSSENDESVEEVQPISRQDHNIFPSQYENDNTFQGPFNYNYDDNSKTNFESQSTWGQQQEPRPHDDTYDKSYSNQNIPQFENRHIPNYSNQPIPNYDSQYHSNYNNQPSHYNSQQPPVYDSQHRQSTWITEFRPNSDEYDGFVPSVGPVGSPPTYKDIPIYKTSGQHKEYNSKFVSKYREAVKSYFHNPTTPSDFKPSTEYVKYSEPDPFYHSQEAQQTQAVTPAVQPSYNYVTILNFNNTTNSNKVQSKLPSTIIDIETIPPITTISPLEQNIANTTQITNATTSIQLTLEVESEGKVITQIPKSTESPKLQPVLRQKQKKNRVQQQKHRNKNRNKYNIGIMYPQWGEKIKTTTETVNVKQNVKDQTSNISDLEISSFTTPITESTTMSFFTDLPTENETQGSFNDTVTGNGQNTETTDTVTESTTYYTESYTEELNVPKSFIEKKSRNIEIDNMKNKTPEEIVSTLTIMGLENKTDHIKKELFDKEGDLSQQSSNVHSSKVTKFPNINDKELSQSRDPISIVVNTISQSYSYKTSKGHTGNLRHSYMHRLKPHAS